MSPILLDCHTLTGVADKKQKMKAGVRSRRSIVTRRAHEEAAGNPTTDASLMNCVYAIESTRE